MKAVYVPTNEEVRARRKQRYLELWPIETQMEALSEASMGRPEKLEKMKEDFAETRRALPFYCDTDKGGK